MFKHSKRICFLFTWLVLLTPVLPQSDPNVGLVPRPAQLERRDGVWVLNEQTRIVANQPGVPEAERLADALAGPLGRRLSVAAGQSAKGGILMLLDQARRDLADEGYELEVGPDGVRMAARTTAGLFYAAETFRQLLPAEAWRRSPAAKTTTWTVPCVRILDKPRFAWRGLLLDTARHFIPKRTLLEMLDAMAMHKLNRLQLHLTDDQGWRIEIRSFPLLTARSSWRSGTLIGHLGQQPQRFSNVPHGGFYSQQDLREIVAHAAERHIVVVPEIEMPGHARAWLSAYPEYAVFPEKAAKMEPWQQWGVSKDVLAPRPATLEACKRILDEVCEIFPSPWIHTGGDEAPRDQWNESTEIQALIKSLGLQNADQLQGWFTAEMSRYLAGKGRRLVGWDEILAGAELTEGATKTGLDPSAIVHSWRGIQGAVAAAKAGHDAIMSPYQWVYLDYYQGPRAEEPLAIGGSNSLGHTYGFDPIPASLPQDAAARILGGQTQVWTEYIPDSDAVYYMTFPRTCAMAEVFWSPREGKDPASFMMRLEQHEKRLKAAGISYRPLARRTSWPQASGMILADPKDAVIHGADITRREDGALTGWKDPETLIAWRVQLSAPGRYRVRLRIEPSAGSAPVDAVVAGSLLQAKEPVVDPVDLGSFQVTAPGPRLLFLLPRAGSKGPLPVVKGVELEPER